LIPRVPEPNKKPGVCYAVTDDGLELPVVDVTHAVFACTPSTAELVAITETTLRNLHRSRRMPGFLRRWVARRSILMRGTLDAAGTFVSGMTTYLYKLGPGNLGARYAGAIDRRLASSVTAVAIRLRLRAMARMLADDLSDALAARPGRALHLINIGGGTASDSLNALLVLRAERPEALRGRQVMIRVLDCDAAGPAFGARSLAALLAPGAPLHGLDATLEHFLFDWSAPARFGPFPADAVVAGSSEGGLFEYGTDAAIHATLAALRSRMPEDFVMVGSVMRDGAIAREIARTGALPLRLFTPEAFATLAGRAGWKIARADENNPLYRVVSLKSDRG
jgi:hypothetical protein